MDGYRNNPELTAETFAGGWLHTGDVAVRDPGGFLRIIDRTKDMIVSGGFNIYPREIEDIIARASGRVSGRGDRRTASKVGRGRQGAGGAASRSRPRTAEELIAMVAQRKGSFQAPKIVEFIDSIPQTAVGKPDKKALRARFGQAAA